MIEDVREARRRIGLFLISAMIGYALARGLFS